MVKLLANTALTYFVFFILFSILIPIVHIFIHNWMFAGLVAGLGVRFLRVYIAKKKIDQIKNVGADIVTSK